MTLLYIPSVVLVKAIVRVYILKAAGTDLKWIFILIKVHIPKAVAVRVLYSGDIEVTLPNQEAKDQTLTQGDTPKCKILRQDFPVKIIRVPLTIQIKSRKGAINI